MTFTKVPDNNGLAGENKAFTYIYNCIYRTKERRELQFSKMGI
jgi:hypothetical protein